MSERSFGAYPRSPITIRCDLSPEDAWAFLRRVVRDEDFRAELEQNPRFALERAGITVSEGAFPEWARLPSEDEIRQLAAIVEPELNIDHPPDEDVAAKPTPPSFGTCLWMAVGLAVASQATQSEPVESAS
jgi:hypothetical protein